jgi:hypothetical protein
VIRSDAVTLNMKQIEALADLMANTLSHEATLEQTYTRPGGTHLYAEVAGGRYHIAASTGRVQELA